MASFIRCLTVVSVALLGLSYLVDGRTSMENLRSLVKIKTRLQNAARSSSSSSSSSGDVSRVFAVDLTNLRTRFVEFQYAALLCELHRALDLPVSAELNSSRPQNLPSHPREQDDTFEACRKWAERALDLNDSTAMATEFITPLMNDIETYLVNETVVDRETRRVVKGGDVAPIATSPTELMERLAKLENVGGWFRVPPEMSGFDVPVFQGQVWNVHYIV